MNAFDEAVRWLYGTQLFGVKLGLDGMRRLAAALEVRTGGEGGPRFIHVAGTNGKGSTCAMLDSVCRAGGVRTGLYTSPHLVSLRERFQFGGERISAVELCAGLERVRALVADWETHPTFFEIVTALALEWFQQKEAQVVVLETGLGGRLDATNIVTPAVSVVTPIGLDHQQYLGGTLEAIAREKAGIFKPGVPVVSAPQAPEVLRVLEQQAREVGCPFHLVGTPWNGGPVGLCGDIQRWNAAVAAATLEAARISVPNAALVHGLETVRWPGRFQRVGADLVLDGAHNVPAAAVLAQTWREVFAGQKARVIFGALQDKDVAGVLRELEPVAAEFVLVPVHSPRAVAVESLAALVREALPGVPCSAAANVAEALERGVGGPRLVTGSLYLVGEVLALSAGEAQEWSAQ